MIGKCKDCKKVKKLTRHSRVGGHKPPFVFLCVDCHEARHGIKHRKYNYNGKFQKGTVKSKKIKRIIQTSQKHL